MLDKPVMVAVGLDADYVAAAPREQFERDAARAGEQVEGSGAFEVDIPREHIEDVLLGEVGRGPCLECARYVEVTSLIFSGDDAHNSK